MKTSAKFFSELPHCWLLLASNKGESFPGVDVLTIPVWRYSWVSLKAYLLEKCLFLFLFSTEKLDERQYSLSLSGSFHGFVKFELTVMAFFKSAWLYFIWDVLRSQSFPDVGHFQASIISHISNIPSNSFALEDVVGWFYNHQSRSTRIIKFFCKVNI